MFRALFAGDSAVERAIAAIAKDGQPPQEAGPR